MPNKIEHKIENGIELKRCSTCEKWLALTKFHKTGSNTWDGLFYQCGECTKQKRKTNLNLKAGRAWLSMNKRVKNEKVYLRKGIKINLSRKDFVKWYIDNSFDRCVVDRKDNEGDYEITNLQMITFSEHNIKHRQDRLQKLGVKEHAGMRYCYRCNKEKSIDLFYRRKRQSSKGNPLGLDEVCKPCRRLERMSYYKNKKKKGAL